MIDYYLTGKENLSSILFVHGLGANMSQFEAQHRYFDNKYQVLSLTLSNHSLDYLADEIIILLDRLQIEKVHFVGNSMGGNVGFTLLKKYPQRLYTITTFGTTPSLKTSKIKLYIAAVVIKFLPLFLIAKIGSYTGINKASRNKIHKMLRQTSKKVYLSMLPHIANFDYSDIIIKAKKPFCIIRAENDKEINKQLDKYVKLWEDEKWCNVFYMQKVGHFVNLDAPHAFNKALEKCLSKNLV